jgi:hypothetical protein
MRFSKKSADEIALQQFADFLVEETMNASDQEIIDQVREDYGDPNKLADEATAIFERAWKAVNDPPSPTRSAIIMSYRPKTTAPR